MEEIICQFEGWVNVNIHKIKENNYVLHDNIKTYIDSEKKAIKLLNKFMNYHACIFLLYKDKSTPPNVPLKTIFKETSSDLCLVQQNNCLFIRDFDKCNLAMISGDTCLVIYPQGLEKLQCTGRSSYEFFYYLVPVIVVLVYIYFIEKGLENQKRDKIIQY